MLIHIRNLLTALWYQLTSRDYRLIRSSGLFDPDYYRRNNPDIEEAGTDPLVHYLTRGYLEQRRPSALFDQSYYCHQAPDLIEREINPLSHYLKEGSCQGLRPNLLVDPAYYAIKNPDFDPEETDTLSHFLANADSNGSLDRTPSPYFDHSFYCRRYPDAAPRLSSVRAAYQHALEIGVDECRQPSRYFDSAYYLDKNPSLAEIGLDPLSHYRRYGAEKRRSPCPLFDPHFYAATYGGNDCDDLFVHFLSGQHDERRPCVWFDPSFYRRTYLDENDKIPPLKHYLESGITSQHYPNDEAAQLRDKPVISVLVPVYNVRPCFLNSCIRSVFYQSYPHWELCLVDDCSTDPEIRQILKKWEALDPRISISFLPKNSGISAATNAAAELASGSYLAFLDNDDELVPTALQTFATLINKKPAELYYSDEVLIGEDGQWLSVFRKPGLNRELLLSHNYVTHCVVTKRSLFMEVGGCDETLDGAQDHDLFLKLSEASEAVRRIPEILYHWRASDQSTSINHSRKQYADDAGRKSVGNAVTRLGERADVLPTELKFFYRPRRRIQTIESAALVIFWQGSSDSMGQWASRAVASAGHPVAQLIFVMDEPSEPSLAETINRVTGVDTICRSSAEPTSSPAAFQLGSMDLTSSYAVFISCPLSFRSENWLSALVEYGQSDEIGMVSGRVDYPDTYYDVITPVPDCRNPSPAYYLNFVANCSVFMNGRHCQQQVRGVHSDLALIRTDLLHSQGGFRTGGYPYLFTLVDLSFRLHQGGWKNIYTPFCRANRAYSDFERCRGLPVNELQEEKIRFQASWVDLLAAGDPFYNPGLILDNGLSLDDYRRWLQSG